MLRASTWFLGIVTFVSSVGVVGLGCSTADEETAPEDDSALTASEGLSGPLAAGTKLVTTANVNFRSEPVIGDNVKRVVPNGTSVEAVGGDAQDGFYAVTMGTSTGFMSARYLALAPAADGGTEGGAVTDGPHVPPSGDFKVSYIGDSHSDYAGNARGAFGFLGQHLDELMQQDGTPIAIFAASGSVPSWWFDDTSRQAATWGYTQTSSSPARQTCSRGGQSGPCVPKLATILSDHPSLFVIEQGTNLLGRGASDIKNQVRTMLAQIAGKTDACLWVGAPNARTGQHSKQSQDDLWQIIRDNAGGTCFTYDSRFTPRTDSAGRPALDGSGNLIVDVPLPYSPDANNDGEHMGMSAAGKWAEGVAMMIEHIKASRR